MYQLIKHSLTLFLLINLIGCQDYIDREPDITGYVVEQTDNHILVASETPTDLSKNGGVANFHQMIWFANPPNVISHGDKIDVWYDQLQESYPARSTIVHYVRHSDELPEGATFTEAEVLEHVLTQLNNEPNQLFAIQIIDFDQIQQTWNITLIEIWTQQLKTIAFSEIDQVISDWSS